MRSFLLSLAALATAAAGLFAATVVAPARATTVSLGDLPALGYTLELRADLSSSPPCSNYWVTGGNGAPETLIGDPSHLACTAPEVMQARIDALLAAFPPAQPTTTTDPQTVFVTTTIYDTTTATITETLPVMTTAYDTTTVTLPAPPPVTTTLATTVTTPALPAETVTVTQPAETTTIATTTTAMTATVAGPTVTLTTTLPAETVTQTVTVQAPPPEPEWLTALAARSQALNDLYALS